MTKPKLNLSSNKIHVYLGTNAQLKGRLVAVANVLEELSGEEISISKIVTTCLEIGVARLERELEVKRKEHQARSEAERERKSPAAPS